MRLGDTGKADVTTRSMTLSTVLSCTCCTCTRNHDVSSNLSLSPYHVVNLCIFAGCNMQGIRNMQGTVNEFYIFFSLSPKRQQELQVHIPRRATRRSRFAAETVQHVQNSLGCQDGEF